MNKKLPRYSISIDPELALNGEKLGMDMIAYTATPAIIKRGVAFNEIKAHKYTDILKYRLAAPILIPELPIYRQDDELGEYEVVFSRETIEALYEDFMLNKGKAAFNLDHNSELEAPSFILESWITGPSATDASFTKYGIELPEGSVFVVSQFTDKEYFQKEIIEKDRLGYSIEGFLGLALSTIKQKLKTNKMNETKLQMPDGEYPMADGSIMIIKDGICEIKKVEGLPEALPVAAEELEAVTTELAEDKVIEDAQIDEPIVEAAPVMDEMAILAIIQPKLDEIYKVIAEIKTMIEADNAEDIIEEEVAMTKLSAVKSLASFFTLNK